MEIENLLNTIIETQDVWVAGPVSSELIIELEDKLNTKLPDSYKGFLLNYGAISIGDSVISGITCADINEGGGSVYSDTQYLIKEYELPKHLVVIQADEEAPYCLDSSQVSNNGEMPVVCYELNNKHSSKLSSNFKEWLLSYLSRYANG